MDSTKVESFEAYIIDDKLVYINIVVKNGVANSSSIATIQDSKYNPITSFARGFVSNGNMTSIIVVRKNYGDLFYSGNTSTAILSGSFYLSNTVIKIPLLSERVERRENMFEASEHNDKIPIKRIIRDLGNVTIGNYGYSPTISIPAISGYTCILAQLQDFTSNPSYEPFSLLMYSPTQVIVLGKANSAINSLKIRLIYVSNEYFDIQTN